jgi:hypothetical protein
VVVWLTRGMPLRCVALRARDQPADGGVNGLLLKITDFGLSRDKNVRTHATASHSVPPMPARHVHSYATAVCSQPACCMQTTRP